jgi:GNAT superfamily N-acetyltransferase
VIRLRDGTADDAAALLVVHRDAALAAYGDVFPPDRYSYPEQETLDDLAARLAKGAVIVAEDDSGVIGFAAISEGWLERLYVVPGRWGGGVGAQLHDAAVGRRRAAPRATGGCGYGRWRRTSGRGRSTSGAAGASTERPRSLAIRRTRSTSATRSTSSPDDLARLCCTVGHGLDCHGPVSDTEGGCSGR